MPLRDVSQTSAPRGLVVPACGNCHRPDRVRAVDVDDVSPGVQYWRCDGCGFISRRRRAELTAARAS
jgi:hypothetical protein